MQFDQEKLEAAIIEKVSNELLDNISISDAIRSRVDAEMNKRIANGVSQALDGVIKKALDDGFDHAYYRIDSFGRSAGEQTTIRAELERRVQGYWSEKVDKNGQRSDSYNAITRAEYIMLNIAADSFSKEMKQHMVNVGSHLKDSLRAELRQTLDQLLTEVFHVKSLGDQGKAVGERNTDGKQYSSNPAAV